MGWTHHLIGGGNSDKTAGTTLSIGTTLYDPVAGDLIVLVAALDNTQTTDGDSTLVTSVTDDSGNTYSKVSEKTNGQGASAGGATVSVWYANCLTPLTAGINVNFGTTTAKALAAAAFSPTNANGGTLASGGVSWAAGDAVDPVNLSLGPSEGNREYLWIYGLAAEGPSGETDTADGANGWTQSIYVGTSGGGAAANMSATLGYSVATTASKNCDWTHTARDHVQLICAFIENAAPSAFRAPPHLPFIPRGRSF